MYHRNSYTEDVGFINGCSIRRIDTSGTAVISLSTRNKIVFLYEKRSLIILKLEYSGFDNLCILVEALRRFAFYTNTIDITCDKNLPLDAITVLDDSGIMDMDLQQD